ALLIAFLTEGSVRFGVLVGYLSGAALFALGHQWQKGVCERQPSMAMHTFAILFLAKLVTIGLAFALLTFFEPISNTLDRKSFLLSFVAAVFLVSILGTWESSRVLTGTSRERGPAQVGPSQQA
ncbi:MAG: hypothetical protein AAF368_17135, partial [Planctomycetota bacterium]